MDAYKAQSLAVQLKNKILGKILIEELIHYGKSAAVFKGKTESKDVVAIKVFDNDIVERYGYEIQEQRIKQELGLIGHNIPNLVQIKDGGTGIIDGISYFYIVMEYIEGIVLSDYIKQKNYNQDFIIHVFKTLYSISELLLCYKEGIAHRDIKPENIKIKENGEIILMDLSVIKFVGIASFSDSDETQFVATLRYAPPEFLTREENNTVGGWRAINIYQIGAVLHDMIMKKELFAEVTPYTKLVLAIKSDPVRLNVSGIEPSLLQITRNMLSKDWQTRLLLCSNEIINSFFNETGKQKIKSDEKISLILERTSQNKITFEEITAIQKTNKEKDELRKEISAGLVKVIISVIDKLHNKSIIPDYNESVSFNLPDDYLEMSEKRNTITNKIFHLKESLEKGFSRQCYLWFKISNTENNFTIIDGVGILTDRIIPTSSLFNGRKILHEPEIKKFFKEISKEHTPNQFANRHQPREIPSTKIFEGIVELDEGFNEIILTNLLDLIQNIINRLLPEVTERLDGNKNLALGRVRTLGMRVSGKSIFIH